MSDETPCSVSEEGVSIALYMILFVFDIEYKKKLGKVFPDMLCSFICLDMIICSEQLIVFRKKKSVISSNSCYVSIVKNASVRLGLTSSSSQYAHGRVASVHRNVQYLSLFFLKT